MWRPLVTSARVVLLAVALLATGGCSAVDAPRRADRSATDISAVSFESPRQTYVVEASPDIGNVAFRGTVRSRDRQTVLAPTDGRVLEVFFATNETVTAGEDVLVFVPAPTEAELIGLEILQLEIDQLIADDATEAEIAQAETTLADTEAAYSQRTEVFRAERDGVIGTTRQNIAYRVPKAGVLYELSDPSDLLVEVVVSSDDLDSVVSGSAVSLLASADATSAPLTGTIFLGADETEPGIVELDDPTAVSLGDRLSVSLPVQPTASVQWIPLDVVGRQDGASYVLVPDTDDRLRRVTVDLGRRTQSHVQVLSGLHVGMELVRP